MEAIHLIGMNDAKSQIRRLTRWNRFWLVLVALYTLIAGYNYLERRIISNATRLQVRWEDNVNAKGDGALIVSSSGGPFIVTHLAVGSRDIDTALAAIAQLPRPLLIRPKSYKIISLSGLVWIDSEGKRTTAPKPNAPVQALYCRVQTVTIAE